MLVVLLAVSTAVTRLLIARAEVVRTGLVWKLLFLLISRSVHSTIFVSSPPIISRQPLSVRSKVQRRIYFARCHASLRLKIPPLVRLWHISYFAVPQEGHGLVHLIVNAWAIMLWPWQGRSCWLCCCWMWVWLYRRVRRSIIVVVCARRIMDEVSGYAFHPLSSEIGDCNVTSPSQDARGRCQQQKRHRSIPVKSLESRALSLHSLLLSIVLY